MSETPNSGPVPVTEGPFAGWLSWGPPEEPFEDLTGPFYFRTEDDGRVRAACMVERRHLNATGVAHGGFIMTFIDFALFAISYRELAGRRFVTIGCETQFIGAGREGIMLAAEGDVLRSTRSLIFVQGRVTQAGELVAGFSGTLKKRG